MNRYLLLLFVLLFSVRANAQQYDTASIFNTPISMDTVVVKAARSGWDIQAFIKMVRTDTTFYKAFKSMRVLSYTAQNDIRVYGKHDDVVASLNSRTTQHAWKGCRSMQTFNKKVTGDIYKRTGEYNYYTVALYDYLFFTKDTVCGNSDIVAGAMQEQGSGTIEKSKYQLKQLIFNPGSKISGIPLIGNKASVFDEDEAHKYDFHLLSEDFAGEECYVFKVSPKPEYASDVVFNELTTWFRKSDNAIVARDYSLSYNTLVYDLDVRMKVRTTHFGDRLVPSSIDYDGNWHILGKKRERVRFVCTLSYE